MLLNPVSTSAVARLGPNDWGFGKRANRFWDILAKPSYQVSTVELSSPGKSKELGEVLRKWSPWHRRHHLPTYRIVNNNQTHVKASSQMTTTVTDSRVCIRPMHVRFT